jgi:hypothetical protein
MLWNRPWSPLVRGLAGVDMALSGSGGQGQGRVLTPFVTIRAVIESQRGFLRICVTLPLSSQ